MHTSMTGIGIHVSLLCTLSTSNLVNLVCDKPPEVPIRAWIYAKAVEVLVNNQVSETICGVTPANTLKLTTV